jgi:hypothetical protein
MKAKWVKLAIPGMVENFKDSSFVLSELVDDLEKVGAGKADSRSTLGTVEREDAPNAHHRRFTNYTISVAVKISLLVAAEKCATRLNKLIRGDFFRSVCFKLLAKPYCLFFKFVILLLKVEYVIFQFIYSLFPERSTLPQNSVERDATKESGEFIG